MGAQGESDGRISGTYDVQTIQCDAQTFQCAIPVHAPSVALVFLTDEAYANSGGEDGQQSNGDVLTFATTTTTGRAKPTIDMQAVATSNGHSGSFPMMATSKGGSVNAGGRRMDVPGVGGLMWGMGFAVAAALGWSWVLA